MPAKAATKRVPIGATDAEKPPAKLSRAVKAKSDASSAPSQAGTPSSSSSSKRKLDDASSVENATNDKQIKKAALSSSGTGSKGRPAKKKEPFVTSKVDADESINSGASASLVRAEAHATTLLKTLHAEGNRAPTDAEITEVRASCCVTYLIYCR